jgi:hypothetical protein
LRRSLQRVPRISIHRPTASDAQASAESGSHFRHGKATFNLSPLCILWSDGHDLCEQGVEGGTVTSKRMRWCRQVDLLTDQNIELGDGLSDAFELRQMGVQIERADAL